MLKSLIEEQEKKLNEQKKDIIFRIAKIDHELNMLHRSYEKQKENSTRKKESIKKLEDLLNSKENSLNIKKNDLNNQITKLENEFKLKLKGELNKIIKKLEKLNIDLCDIRSNFDASYEEIVSKIMKIEDLTLIENIFLASEITSKSETTEVKSVASKVENKEIKKENHEKKAGTNFINEDEKIIAFFNNNVQNKDKFKDYVYEKEDLIKIINLAYLDEFEDVVEKIKKLTNADDKIELSSLMIARKNQLNQIQTVSDKLKNDMDVIDLEHYNDNEYVNKLVEMLKKYVISINDIYSVIKDIPTNSIAAIKYDSLVSLFVEFNNKVSTKFNIEKYRVKPMSKQFYYKENGRINIARLNKESLKENGLKELFANTTKILKAKDSISAIKWKVRTDELEGLSLKERKVYDKAVNDISEELFVMLKEEVERLKKGEFLLRPVFAFDAWTLLLSIMPDNMEVEKKVYNMGHVTELVMAYIDLISTAVKNTNDESIKSQLNKSDYFDIDECYSTIASICLYRKENEYFEFKDNSSKNDDETLFANSYTVLYGIKYIDPESKVKDYISEVSKTYVNKLI